MRTSTPQRVRPLLGAAVGLLLVVVMNVLIVIFDPQITRAVPLLLLLVPVTLASAIGGWKASVPLALLTACVYSFHFIAPVGEVRLGFTGDTATVITFVGVAIFLSEVSRRLDRNRALREEQRSVLLRSVSHDLRNPLGTIQAASTQLRGDAIKDAATRDQLLDLIVSESERLDRIIRNLLSLGRIEAGALSPAIAPESLSDIVTSSVRRLERAASDHRQHIEVDLEDDLPDVMVDRTQLDQVLTNLVENALRHAEGSDIVRIGARRSNGHSPMVTVTVSDTGPGFAPAARANAFSFFRPSGPTAGEGVGLAVCKSIIEAHGGSITADDEPDGGARVEFSVPAAR